MSVGMLTVTHHQLGQQLVDIASRIFARPPENLACYGIVEDCDLDTALSELRDICASLDCKDGLLILSDLYGATPYNLSKKLMREYPETTLVSGINLPMVVKLFNLQQRSRSQLAESLATNGRIGIIIEAGEPE